MNIPLPHKKPKGKDLSQEQKEENKKFSSQRVACEHAHAGIKRYNAVSSIYRNRVADFDDHLMLTSAGLWNFYLESAEELEYLLHKILNTAPCRCIWDSGFPAEGGETTVCCTRPICKVL